MRIILRISLVLAVLSVHEYYVLRWCFNILKFTALIMNDL